MNYLRTISETTFSAAHVPTFADGYFSQPQENVATKKSRISTEVFIRLLGAKNFIDLNLSLPLTVTEMAGFAHMSQFHFCRLFKELFKQSPYQYYLSKKIVAAASLLSSTAHSITDVAVTTGFADVYSFSKVFKSFYGVSPSQFRAGNTSKQKYH